jgi:metal-dependent amidase/aminoacylase/carboxypeptidase family protein
MLMKVRNTFAMRLAKNDRVKLLGTVRSLHPETHEKLPDWIEQIVASVCQAYGAKYELNYYWQQNGGS